MMHIFFSLDKQLCNESTQLLCTKYSFGKKELCALLIETKHFENLILSANRLIKLNFHLIFLRSYGCNILVCRPGVIALHHNFFLNLAISPWIQLKYQQFEYN